MPAMPLGENLVSLIAVGGSSVLGFWLAAEFADLQCSKNHSPQQTVGVHRVASSTGEDRTGFRFFRDERDAIRALAASFAMIGIGALLLRLFGAVVIPFQIERAINNS